MVTCALLAAIATILQASGSLVPFVGLFISPFTTLPIVLAALIGFRYGCISYVATIILLILIEPSELFVFPFTTGLLGLGLGLSLTGMRRRLFIISLYGFLLSIGIMIPLYVFKFPIFGPVTNSDFEISLLMLIALFSLFYSVLWVELSLIIIRRLHRTLH